MKKKILLMFIMVLSDGFMGCQAGEKLAVWRNRNISIDGKLVDWSGHLTLNYDSNMAFGFLRDSTYFYLCLVISDQEIQRQIMGQGLVVWFKADKKTENRIGIKFPLGMMASGTPPTQFAEGGPGKDEERKKQMMGQMFKNNLNELEIQVPGEKSFDRYIVSEIAESGLEITAALESEQLVYELKIPLIRGENSPYALGIENVCTVGLEIETPKMDREAMRGKMMPMGSEGGWRGGPPDGMSGGGPPGGGMRGGGPGGGMGPKETEPFKAKFTVRLESEK